MGVVVKRPQLAWVTAGAVAYTLLMAMALAVGRPWRSETAGVLGALVVTGMLVAFACAAPVRRFLGSLPRAHRAIAIATVSLLVLGHTLGLHRVTFPLVRWDMFTWVYEPERVVFHQMIGIRPDGTQIPLNFTHIAPSLHGTFYWSLESWGEHAEDNERYAQIYSFILDAFGQRFNAQHPNEPIAAVATVRGTISRTESGALDVRHASHWRVMLERSAPP
jgi:hypothetical protein